MELYKLTIIIIDIILIILSITTIRDQQMNEQRNMRWFFDESYDYDWGTYIQDITLILNAFFILYLAVEVIDWNYKIPIF